MKKILLTFVIASVVSATQAQPQITTDTGSVAIYGVLDQGLYSANDGSSSSSGITSLGSSTTRLGIKGQDNLGGGVKSGFNLEAQVNMANGAVGSSATGASTGTGTTSIFTRAANMFIGNKEFGEVTLGRQTTAVTGNYSKFDALNVNSLGLVNYFNPALVTYGTNKLTGVVGTGGGGLSTSYNTEGNFYANGIKYNTPTFYNTTIQVFTSPGNNSSGATRDAMAMYDDGKLSLGAGHGQSANSAGNYVMTTNVLGASYKLNNWKFSLSQIQVLFDNNSTVGHNTRIRQAGVKYQINSRLWAGTEYTMAQDTTNANNSSNTIGLATGYTLSKRTELYAMYGHTVNNGVSAMNPIYGANTVTSGSSVNAIVTGITYSF